MCKSPPLLHTHVSQARWTSHTYTRALTLSISPSHERTQDLILNRNRSSVWSCVCLFPSSACVCVCFSCRSLCLPLCVSFSIFLFLSLSSLFFCLSLCVSIPLSLSSLSVSLCLSLSFSLPLCCPATNFHYFVLLSIT
jgi:hypothetical protein